MATAGMVWKGSNGLSSAAADCGLCCCSGCRCLSSYSFGIVLRDFLEYQIGGWGVCCAVFCVIVVLGCDGLGSLAILRRSALSFVCVAVTMEADVADAPDDAQECEWSEWKLLQAKESVPRHVGGWLGRLALSGFDLERTSPFFHTDC